MAWSLNRFVRKLRIWGGSLFALGIILVKLPVDKFRPYFEWLPNFVTEPLVNGTGFILFVAGILLGLGSWSVHIVRKWSGVLKRRIITIRFGEESFDLRVLKPEDLPATYPVYQMHFGNELLPQAQVESWMAKNPLIAFEVLRKVKKGLDETDERVGFFEMLPLARSGEQKLTRAEPRTADILDRDIHSAVRWHTASAYYIASVGVIEPANIVKQKRRDLAARKHEGAVMKLLRQRLQELSTKSAISVYARPVTSRGLDLVEDYSFSKLQKHKPDTEAIWRGDVRLNGRPPRKRR
ncbi:MAG TPA: hypothetical protein VK624_15145 [Steroidobacteraceae bacterium]|nr:hypothetical protein [Steroidobacteraceae bacterium]